MATLSVRKTLQGKRILLTGGSGFLGKVWLSYVLHQLPELGKLTVLMRRGKFPSARDRFEHSLNTSPVFLPLHQKYGASLSAYLLKQVEVLDGDVTHSDLGLLEMDAERVARETDLLLNCAGLVDFNPSIHDAISVNVEGLLNVIQFAKRSAQIMLLHVSTCYVSGSKEGRIHETLNTRFTPNRTLWSPNDEYERIKKDIQKTEAYFDSPEFVASVEPEIQKRLGTATSPQKEEKMLRMMRRKQLRDALIRLGETRAHQLGWPNTYTYTKSLSEALLVENAESLHFSIFRPSIVESSYEYPFPGWNEGFNTSGPLAYLLGGWFRYLPATVGNPFDVIPVDFVAKAMTSCSAALLASMASKAYHCGTSDLNCFTIDQAIELTSLGHKEFYTQEGTSWVERQILSRWRTVPVKKNHLFSVSRVLRATEKLERAAEKLSLHRFRNFLQRSNRKLRNVDTLLELFMPYIHDYHVVFETKNLSGLPIEESEFEFLPERINWKQYWVGIHMPGLRRWCFPVIEGKTPQPMEPKEKVDLSAQPLSQLNDEVPRREVVAK